MECCRRGLLVGTPNGQTFKDPSTAALPSGCSYGVPFAQSVGCSGAGPFVFNGWDFSLHNCILLYFDGTTSGTVTIENSKFVNGTYCNTTVGATWLVKVDSGSTASVTAINNTATSTGALDNVNDWIIFFSSGAYTEKYNYYSGLCKGVITWGSAPTQGRREISSRI